MATVPTAQASEARELAFALRLKQALDAHPHAPDGYGRLNWLAIEIGKRLGKSTSAQTASRWMRGEVKPRKETSDQVAQMLGVDPLWLYMGVGENLKKRERESRAMIAEGVVNLVAGMIQIDGGAAAFPEDDDKRAVHERVNLYAIIKGANYALNITMAAPVGESYQFSAPTKHDNIVVLTVIRSGFTYRVFEISADNIAEYGMTSADGILVTMTEQQLAAQEITSFANRL